MWAAPLQQEPFIVDTYIFIGNDYYTDVWVKCYWVDWEQQIQDFMFRLTPNQPVVFSALEGLGDGFVTVPPFQGGYGELKCWAVNAVGDSQIAFNHLYGNALLVQENAGVMYNAGPLPPAGWLRAPPLEPAAICSSPARMADMMLVPSTWSPISSLRTL